MKLYRVVFSGLVAGMLFASLPAVQANEQSKESAVMAATTLSGMLVATKTDTATNKATAFDIQTSDGKVYHVTFDEKVVPTMSSDLGAVINQQVELTGELSKTDPQTITITSFRKVETAPQ